MRNAILLALNTLKLTLRRKGNLIVIFAVPVVGILVSMIMYANVDSGVIKVGLSDYDKSVISQDMVKALNNEEKFKITVIDDGEAGEKVSSSQVDGVLVIPQGFEEGIINGRPLQVEIVSIKGAAATSWIENYANIYIRNLVDISGAAGDNREAFEQMYNSYTQENMALKVTELKDRVKSKGMTSQSIGFLIMFMMIGAGNTAEMILREKRNRTYFRILATPVNGKFYVLGNIFANLVIVTAQILVTLLLMVKVFDIETYISFTQLFVILAFFGLTAIGLGLLIVAFASNSTQANTLQMLIITPTSLLAGCFWPIEIMPKVAQRMADFLPQKWVIAAVQKLQEGGSFDQILSNLLILLVFALAFFLVAAYRFGSNDSVKNFV